MRVGGGGKFPPFHFYYIKNREEVLIMLSTVVKIAMLVSMTIKAIDDLLADGATLDEDERVSAGSRKRVVFFG